MASFAMTNDRLAAVDFPHTLTVMRYQILSLYSEPTHHTTSKLLGDIDMLLWLYLIISGALISAWLRLRSTLNCPKVLIFEQIFRLLSLIGLHQGIGVN